LNRPILLGIAVPTLAGTFVWGGCALVIGLGSEAQLRNDAAVVDSAEAPPDAAADAPVNLCGLPPTGAPKCDTCTVQNCCDVNKACAADPGCVLALECIKNCLAQVACFGRCLADGGQGINDVVGCETGTCLQPCTPSTDCQKLGACASLLDPDAGKFFREVAREEITALSDQCEDQRLIIGSSLNDSLIDASVDASICH
jgi:hypothetical protein